MTSEWPRAVSAARTPSKCRVLPRLCARNRIRTTCTRPGVARGVPGAADGLRRLTRAAPVLFDAALAVGLELRRLALAVFLEQPGAALPRCLLETAHPLGRRVGERLQHGTDHMRPCRDADRFRSRPRGERLQLLDEHLRSGFLET